jgi:transglutaminase-like putative cysteine protease
VTMRFDIHYECRFVYDQLVRESQNELRVCPLSDQHQHLVNYRVVVPSSRVLSFTDWWGTRVDAFGVREPHLVLEVVAEATVETRPRPLVTADPRATDLADPAFRDAHAEYLERTRHASWGEAVAEAAAQQVALAGTGVVSQVLALSRFAGSHLAYERGTTYVGVDVDEVFASRTGVCQDFAHLAVSLCRSVGIPARYVSGYLFTEDERVGADVGDDADLEVVDVQTHAWFEAAVPGFGWLALDPTNGLEVGLRHVAIGRGRDYDDVAPLRGAYAGSGGHDLQVSVSMRRTAGVTASPSPPPPPVAPSRYSVVDVPPARPDDGRLQHQPIDSRKQQQQQQQQ